VRAQATQGAPARACGGARNPGRVPERRPPCRRQRRPSPPPSRRPARAPATAAPTGQVTGRRPLQNRRQAAGSPLPLGPAAVPPTPLAAPGRRRRPSRRRWGRSRRAGRRRQARARTTAPALPSALRRGRAASGRMTARLSLAVSAPASPPGPPCTSRAGRARRRLRSRRADCCGSAGLSTRRGCIHACERAALPACGARGAPDEPGSLPATGRAGDGRLTGPPRRQARCGTARGRCRACCWCTRAARWAWTPRPPSRTTWRATTTCGPAPAGRSRRACAQARARPGASPDPDPSMPFQARLRPGARPAQAPALNLTPACRSRRACAQARARPGASPSPDPSMPFQARLRPGAPPAQAPALPRPSILFRRARALSCARAVAGHAQLWRAPLAP